jgi:hypothetical protein
MLLDGLFFVHLSTLQFGILVHEFKMAPTYLNTEFKGQKHYFLFGNYGITKINVILVQEVNNKAQISSLATHLQNKGESPCGIVPILE